MRFAILSCYVVGIVLADESHRAGIDREHAAMVLTALWTVAVILIFWRRARRAKAT